MNTNEMKADSNVLAHIQRKNAERVARDTAEGWTTWFGLACEELAPDYATVYDYEQDMAFSEYSDTYKECYGCRPRFEAKPTLEELNALLAKMYDSDY